MGALVTTSADVLELFNVTPATRQKYSEWSTRRKHVVQHVSAHEVIAAYQVLPSHVEEVCRKTAADYREHALGNIQSESVASIDIIRDWRPDFAFTHVFHFALEQLEQVPTWQQFRSFADENNQARAMLWSPAQRKIAEAVQAGIQKELAQAAMQWRVGNAFYSFLREIYILAHLRATGLDVRIHPLADALFRVDAWIGRTVVNIYVTNPRFRSGARGRKARPEKLLSAASEPFHFREFELPAADQFGKVHLPSKRRLLLTADALSRPGSSTKP